MWKKTKSSNSGFTLLEVLIAMTILVLTFASIFMVESGSLRATETARTNTMVAMLAKNAMIDAEMSFQGKQFTEVKKEETGNFEAPFEDYSWKREIKEVEFPDFAAIANQDNATRESEIMGRLITKHLKSSVREVVVTVNWQRKKGEQSFSLSTYWVNLNHDFSISE